MNSIQMLNSINEAREFDFTSEDFSFIQDVMLRETGISISDCKTSMVYARLVRRLRKTGISSFRSYLSFVNCNLDERISFINALTTNKTQFFREKHHFEYLSNKIIPEWQQKKKRRIRIWSVGCSTGEEPYSIASTLAYHGLLSRAYDCKILATDLNTHVLDVAKHGYYSVDAINLIPRSYLNQWFIFCRGDEQEILKVNFLLQKHITFKLLNIIETWPHKGYFDVIFCRNVMIYFEKNIQQLLISRFWQRLGKDGILFIGHAESIGDMGSRFENLGQTMFRKD
ncbi:CheR family methyltransferase [Candidatus Enterovibrio escicola]|uniref:CheR family methyltransferase n=3 Tax=Candidatus Enterovibrio escicola TaxID=1927127 RepID=UPI0012382D0A